MKRIYELEKALSASMEREDDLVIKNKVLKEEISRLKKQQNEWKCASCEETIYRQSYCVRCNSQWGS